MICYFLNLKQSKIEGSVMKRCLKNNQNTQCSGYKILFITLSILLILEDRHFTLLVLYFVHTFHYHSNLRGKSHSEYSFHFGPICHGNQ